MSNGLCEADVSRVHPGRFDAESFARGVRQLSLDAHDILSRPDSPLDELIGLHWRAWHLLREAASVGSGEEVCRWLLGVRQEIGAKLQSWSVEDLESLVA
jgi:hypothetical protein